MEKEGVRYIIGDGINFDELPVKSMVYGGGKVYKRNKSIAESATPPSSPPVTTTVYGFKIQPMTALGERGKADAQSVWRAVFGTLQVGQGIVIEKKDFDRAQKAVQKYNNAKGIWKPERKFVLEKNVNAEGNTEVGVGRIGRIK